MAENKCRVLESGEAWANDPVLSARVESTLQDLAKQVPMLCRVQVRPIDARECAWYGVVVGRKIEISDEPTHEMGFLLYISSRLRPYLWVRHWRTGEVSEISAHQIISVEKEKSDD